MRRKWFAAAAAIVTLVLGGIALASLDQGFETDIAGWDIFGGLFATRVASGTNGVTSATGAWHAQDSGMVSANADSGPATHWGGYACNAGCAETACAAGVFPAAGYLTSTDIWLDVDGGWANDTRFDYISAISLPAGGHRRDFAFNAGFYNDASGPGGGTNRFVVSASPNATRSSSFPKNPGRDPIAISTTGWYTFQHRFYDSGASVLAVDLSILDAVGNVIHTWTLSDPTDIIGATVGGNRYGWFANQEFSVFAFDNTRMVGCPGSCCDNGPGIASDCIDNSNIFDCEADGGLFLGDGSVCTPAIDCSALAVTLDSFTAQGVANGVMLRWTTAMETDTVGFRLLRETETGREKAIAVVASMIPSAGFGLTGASYEFLDQGARPGGAKVRYYLEDIDIHGKTFRHGPFDVDWGTRQQQQRTTRSR